MSGSGCGAIMQNLTSSEPAVFDIAASISLEQFKQVSKPTGIGPNQPATGPCKLLALIIVNPEQQSRLDNGRPVALSEKTYPDGKSPDIIIKTALLSASPVIHQQKCWQLLEKLPPVGPRQSVQTRIKLAIASRRPFSLFTTAVLVILSADIRLSHPYLIKRRRASPCHSAADRGSRYSAVALTDHAAQRRHARLSRKSWKSPFGPEILADYRHPWHRAYPHIRQSYCSLARATKEAGAWIVGYTARQS